MSNENSNISNVSEKITLMLEEFMSKGGANEIEKTIFIAFAYGFFVESIRGSGEKAFDKILQQLDEITKQGKQACLNALKNDRFGEALEATKTAEKQNQENVVYEAKKTEITSSKVVDLSAYRNIKPTKKEDLN